MDVTLANVKEVVAKSGAGGLDADGLNSAVKEATAPIVIE